MTEELNVIIEGDCLEKLKTIKDESIDCCITSPPYYGLRDYGTGKWVGGDPNCPHRRLSKFSSKTITGHAQQELVGNVGDAIYKTVCPLCGAIREDKQIGLEETPEEYIQKLVDVFHEVKRVLKDDGTLWVNIGDSYAGGQGRWGGTDNISDKQSSNNGSIGQIKNSSKWKHNIIKNKDLIGIPWMLAFALRKDGWYLRQDIIWHKPNPMPESVRDRCTKSHEYIFLLSKKPHYYFDYEAIQEDAVTGETVRDKNAEGYQADYTNGDRFSKGENVYGKDGKRNKRDVWCVTLKPCKEAHFATFPEELIKPCILAGCRVGGVVLDPFFGSGTTGRVAESLGRKYIGIELNPEYIEIGLRRTNNVQLTLDGFLFGQGV